MSRGFRTRVQLPSVPPKVKGMHKASLLLLVASSMLNTLADYALYYLITQLLFVRSYSPRRIGFTFSTQSASSSLVSSKSKNIRIAKLPVFFMRDALCIPFTFGDIFDVEHARRLCSKLIFVLLDRSFFKLFKAKNQIFQRIFIVIQ